MDLALRISAGRTWRLNPAYRDALLRLCATARPDVAGAEVLDVLSIELDGVELAAGVREDHVFRVVGDLARAAERLARGGHKASVTFGLPAFELLLVRQGQSILISLVRLGQSPEVRVRDAALEVGAFFDAVHRCVDEVLKDLRDLEPALASSPFGTRLTVALRRLRARRSRRPRPQAEPALPVPPLPRRAGSRAGDLVCGFELLDQGELLSTFSGEAEGDLHSLLAPGRVHLHDGAGERLAVWEGPPFLAFQALVPAIRELVSAWEAGDRQGGLRFGEVRLRFAGGVAPPGSGSGDPLADPITVSAAVLRAALDFCAAVVSRAPAQRGNAWLTDLAVDAGELLAHCRQLLDGDLTATRPPRAETLSPAGDRASARPLAPWRVRRLRLKQRWSFDSGPLLPAGLAALGRRLLLTGEDGAFALERTTGACVWQREDVQALWQGPRRADPILLASPLGLDLVTPGGATAWSAPLDRAVEPHEPHYLSGGRTLLLSLDGRSVTAFGSADGAVVWRFAPPGTRRVRLCGGPGGAVLAADTGFAYGLEPDTGRVRWRVRTGVTPVEALVPVGTFVIVLGEGPAGPTAMVIDAVTGAGARAHPLPADGLGAPEVFGGRLVLPARIAGEAALLFLRPGEADTLERHLLTGLEGVPRVLVSRSRIHAADAQGRIGAFDLRGRPVWEGAIAPGEGAGRVPPRLAAARGVLLAAREGLYAWEPEAGEPLGALSLPGTSAAHLLTDDHLNVWMADTDGTLLAIGLATHLSVVG